MNLVEVIKRMFQLTTAKILEYVNKELEGQEKKAQVDASVTTWLTDAVSKLGVVQQFLITQYVIPTVPVITQSVYDCIKQKVEGLTE